jgi:hypothetical protein
MVSAAEQSAEPVSTTIDRELRLVREAIAMVASGRSRRVVVGGLRLGEQILEPAGRMATDAGVRLVPLWTIDESNNAIAVERIDA